MSNASQPFDFSQFVPGFDFLKNLAGTGTAGAGAVPGLPSLASWVAPTLSVEEVDKRIQELKTVQYWLEQNGHALKATIQALEVQKMTLSTLRGMNVRMEDIASAFAAKQAGAPAPAPEAPAPAEEAPAPQPAKKQPRGSRTNAESAAPAAAGVVDPMQWWGALTEQFQQIASSALQDAAQLKMPAMVQPSADASGKAASLAPAASRKSAPANKAAPGKKAPSAARKRSAARR
ncbi:ribosomal protein L12E/L44/L45/RPP1/RPP2 [Variovorax sp. TBS-050B]|uniref:PhaM family polyhydroxyalkanoate granule multifunctional regulatory protein n=1 Tax=Variovorax sp. TBS-050B TaxID=2940551 RepID=UPI002475F8EE|nr:PhaM family polyhydroxyalkanoate granule multifunctional regulatory protein [Variovorax sp. TBS-050B]MDH6592675.1 ribosomal protein L12E/L44/L45/RPP1/RPP2 [Variovorax sp. TBS-050B]